MTSKAPLAVRAEREAPRPSADAARSDGSASPSDADFRALADNLPTLCWIADADGYIVWYNRRWHEYCGTTPEAVEGWGWQSVHDPAQLPDVLARWQESVATGEPFDMVFPLRGKDGVFRPFLTRVEPMRDESGKISRWFGMNTEITALRAAEADLRTANERVELALNSGAIVGTWVWDIPADHFTADERFARSFSLDPQQCREGLPLSVVAESIHPDDWPRVEKLIGEVMARGGPYSAEYRVRQVDGSFRWIEANGRCDLDAAGRPIRFPGVLIDIDERKRVEDRLKEREAEAREATRLLKAVIEAVPALIYVKDREGRLKIANSPVMDLIGKPWAEVEGRTDMQVLDDKAQAEMVMATDRRIMEAGATEELEEVVGEDEHGPRIWLSHKTAFRDEQGHVVGLVGTSTEITARKRSEQALAESEAQLRRLIDNLYAYVGVLDLEGNLLEANRTPLEGASLERADVIGKPFWLAPWWSHSPEVQAQIKDAIHRARAGETVRFEAATHWGEDRFGITDVQIAPLRNERGEIVQLIPSGVDITERKRLEERQQLLIRELNHRVKNLFAVAAGMVKMTGRAAKDTREMADALTGRLLALARAHELIRPAITSEMSSLEGTTLHALVTALVEPHLSAGDQLLIEGPEMPVGPNGATSLSLVLHELATNATKYGSLSVPEGRLEIRWGVADGTVTLAWTERGGPPVERPPERTGFGTQLAKMSAGGQLGGSISYDWQPEGMSIVLAVPLERLQR